MLKLGPIPDSLREFIRQLVANARSEPFESDERLNGYVLTAGPSGCSYLTADGQVWNSYYGDSITLVPDGPLKVGLIAITVERVPELALWLPTRPAEALDCITCRGSGQWTLSSSSKIQCPECNGMGWLPLDETPQTSTTEGNP